MVEDDDDDPNHLWCVCFPSAGEDKFMICCDCCHEWYHGDCVGVSPSQGHELFGNNLDYVFPLCLPSSNNQFLHLSYPDPTLTSFQWGELYGLEFCNVVSSAYDKIVHWKQNLFPVPSGFSGKLLVKELSCHYQAYAEHSSWELIALKPCWVLVALVLQKPRRTTKNKDHVNLLNSYLALWKEGKVSSLVDEGRCIQKGLSSGSVPEKNKAACTFNHLMLQGKVHAALRQLFCHSSGGVLNLDAEIPERSSNGSEVMSTI